MLYVVATHFHNKFYAVHSMVQSEDIYSSVFLRSAYIDELFAGNCKPSEVNGQIRNDDLLELYRIMK